MDAIGEFPLETSRRSTAQSLHPSQSMNESFPPSELSPRTRARLALFALGWAVYGGVGCGLSERSSSDQGDPGPNGLIKDDASSDKVTETPSGTSAPEAGSGNRQTVLEETILVHASPDLPAMRLCFDDGDGEPLPTDNIMPRTNQVGVDVGGAASLGALSARVPAGGQQAYLVRVPWTERRDAAGTPQRHQSCQSYLTDGAEKGRDYWPVTIPKLAQSSLLVISGCRDAAVCTTKPTLTAIDLSSIYVPGKGMISAAFLSVSPDALDANMSVNIARGTETGTLLKGGNVKLNEPTPSVSLEWPRLTTSELTAEVSMRPTVSILRGDKLLKTSDFATMAGMVNLTSPLETYFDASRFVFVAVGELAPKESEHPQRSLHLLVLPLGTTLQSTPDPRDGGSVFGPRDAGTKSD